ncbi:carboxypeptidase-like regulatory domain-containing protein [Hyalangium versicolor]|uniref:carboxypeptidase-like regulatory domain-containing protein n=1 Tax=Hyalangium versicolor TaxID=2861190 RepID=UPI001CC945C2|nr:carboxypeptidase-like regulatory domain-containing protein [Hyalangium versicolor]
MDDIYDVMLGEPGQQAHNILVLGGMDIVIPLERDLDGDPMQDDTIRLASLDGSYALVLKASDLDVEPDPDNRLLHYRFRGVPPGVYSVAVNIAGEWSVVIPDLIVRRSGAFLGERKLPSQFEGGPMSAPASADEGSPPADKELFGVPEDESPYIDQEQD